MHSLSVERRRVNRDFATRLVQSKAGKRDAFHCLLVFGQAHRSPVLDSVARAVVRRSSSDVKRGAQLAADPLNVVAYLHAAMRCLSCAACLDAAIRDVVRAYPCPRLHRPGHPPLDSRCCPCVARADEATICGTPSGEAGGRGRGLSDLLLGLCTRDFLHPGCGAGVAIT